MIAIGNFFFKYRNWLFILFYGTLFLPSPPLFTEATWGKGAFWIPVIAGLLISLKGQFLRGLTIGLTQIIRQGKDLKVYAEGLLTDRLYAHCRNPLYVANILSLAGLGILANSFWFVIIMIPFFIFVYESIVLAEENYLSKQYGQPYNQYRQDVPRWRFKIKGLWQMLNESAFDWRRYIQTEYTTLYIWLNGVLLTLLWKYPQLSQSDPDHRNKMMGWIILILGLVYLVVRYIRKNFLK